MQGAKSINFQLNAPLHVNKFSFETMIEKVMSIVREEFGIECRRNSTGKKISGFWELSDFDAKNQRTEFCDGSIFLSMWFPIWTRMKEVNNVVTEKHHFDHRGVSFLITTSWNFWTIKILMQGSISIVFQSNAPLHRNRFCI